MKTPMLLQQEKQEVKARILGLFHKPDLIGVRSKLRPSDAWHDYAQIGKCGPLELAVAMSNRGKIRIYIRLHDTDPNLIAAIAGLACGRGNMSPILHDTGKKSCDVLEIVEEMDWQNLGANEIAVLRQDIQVIMGAWNDAIEVLNGRRRR